MSSDSVLYGQTNPGSIVNYVGKLPLTEQYQKVEFGAGNSTLFAVSESHLAPRLGSLAASA